jgi:hypothetical protein
MIKLRIVLGLPTFDKIFRKTEYTDLRGGILEAMGTLFQDNVKLYLYPYTDMNTGEIIYPENQHFNGEYQLLWQYLIDTRKILILKGIPSNQLKITAGYISGLIEQGHESLQELVPHEVYEHIRKKKLFGYGKNKVLEK